MFFSEFCNFFLEYLFQRTSSEDCFCIYIDLTLSNRTLFKNSRNFRKSRISAVEDKNRPTILHKIFNINQVKKDFLWESLFANFFQFDSVKAKFLILKGRLGTRLKLL